MTGRNGRKFDHDEAGRRYRAGESKRELAECYGVSVNAVRWAIEADEHRYGLRRWWLDRYTLAEIRDLATGLIPPSPESPR